MSQQFARHPLSMRSWCALTRARKSWRYSTITSRARAVCSPVKFPILHKLYNINYIILRLFIAFYFLYVRDSRVLLVICFSFYYVATWNVPAKYNALAYEHTSAKIRGCNLHIISPNLPYYTRHVDARSVLQAATACYARSRPSTLCYALTQAKTRVAALQLREVA